MRALVNGVEGGQLDVYKGQDIVINLQLVNDDGSLITITGDAITLNFYDTVDRRNAAILANAAAIVTAAAGFATVTISDTNTGTLSAGATLYAFAKRDAGTAGAFSLAAKYTVINVK